MSLKELLLSQHRECFREEGWIKPFKTVLSALTDEEFDFKVNEGTHSIRQIINHLIFWDERWLLRIQGKEVSDFTGKNETTFDESAKDQSREKLVKKFLDIMNHWEEELNKFGEEMPYELIFKGTESEGRWCDYISSFTLHNTYHLGQIMQLKKIFSGK